jgi:hypothetical protein
MSLFFGLVKIYLSGTLAEWLRRGPAKAVRYACVSSNLTGVEFFCFFMMIFILRTLVSRTLFGNKCTFDSYTCRVRGTLL